MKKNYLYIAQYIYRGGDKNLQADGYTEKKIGFSQRPKGRLGELSNTKAPIGMEFVKFFEIPNPGVEKSFHRIYKDRHIYGEWFKDDDNSIVQDISSLMKDFDCREITFEQIEEERTQMAALKANAPVPLADTPVIRQLQIPNIKTENSTTFQMNVNDVIFRCADVNDIVLVRSKGRYDNTTKVDEARVTVGSKIAVQATGQAIRDWRKVHGKEAPVPYVLATIVKYTEVDGAGWTDEKSISGTKYLHGYELKDIIYTDYDMIVPQIEVFKGEAGHVSPGAGSFRYLKKPLTLKLY